jgi:hypothetical protein
MSPITRDGVRVVEDGWPPAYVRVVGVPRWLTWAWFVTTLFLVAANVWAALETRAARAEAHEDAQAVIRSLK